MKFGEKLTELRKKKGYSQEELAEKLGVSRQSVSKWESNSTYPETEKIIQIANLFECSMDDLINDKVTNVEQALRKNKNSFTNVWDSLLEFITKTVNMYSKMTFKEGLRSIIEMIILAFLLSILGKIICGTASVIISNIFSFLNAPTTIIIKDVLNSIFYLIWFIIVVITLIYTFKIRYLNKYIDDKDEIENENDNRNEKIKINVKNEKPFEFLSSLSNIVLFFIKIVAFMIMLGISFPTIGLIVATIIAIPHIITNIMILWITLLLISGIIVSIQIIILLINFIFDKKINVKAHIITFISCIILSGVSIGLLVLSIKNIKIVNDNKVFNLEVKEINIKYKDNLVILNNGIGQINNYKYIIDNSISDNDIIINKKMDKKYFKIYTYNSEIDQLPVITIHQDSNNNIKEYYKLFIRNLKDNKIITFNDYGNDPLIIKANETTINNLKNNLKKLYLVEENTNNNETDIIIKDDKVHFENGLNGHYNAIDDTIKYDSDNYSCRKEIEKKEYGEKIIYICNYKEEGEEN